MGRSKFSLLFFRSVVVIFLDPAAATGCYKIYNYYVLLSLAVQSVLNIRTPPTRVRRHNNILYIIITIVIIIIIIISVRSPPYDNGF